MRRKANKHRNPTLLEEKVLYRTLKGSISAMYLIGTPKRFYTLLKKGFLWVL